MPAQEAKKDYTIENQVYDQNLGDWVEQGLAGQVVMIDGDKIIGFYQTVTFALHAMVEKSLEDPFMTHITPRNAVNTALMGKKIAKSKY